jgi:hypothetical protein
MKILIKHTLSGREDDFWLEKRQRKIAFYPPPVEGIALQWRETRWRLRKMAT